MTSYPSQDAARLTAALRQFTGTEAYYKHWFHPKLVYTDGVRFLAREAEAYWLIDAIAGDNHAGSPVQALEHQFWRLDVAPDRSATLVCEDGDGAVILEKRIGWTDFPLDQVEIWVANGVMYLPSEH